MSYIKIEIYKISKEKYISKIYLTGGVVLDQGTTCSSEEFTGEGLGALILEVHVAMPM